VVAAQLGSAGRTSDIYAAGPDCSDMEVIYEDPGDTPTDGAVITSNNSPYCVYWTHDWTAIYGDCGSGQFTLLSGSGTLYPSDVSPDDALVLAIKGQDLITVDAQSGAEQLLLSADAMGHADWGFIYSDPPALSFVDPLPGVAGGPNTFRVSDGTFGEEVTVMYSLSNGGTWQVPNCPGSELELWNPAAVGRAVVDYDRVANITVAVPGVAQGVTVYFQAYEVATCGTSNLVEWTFQ
jgi:hypothetical protein